DDDLVFDYAHYHSNELKVENLIFQNIQYSIGKEVKALSIPFDLIIKFNKKQLQKCNLYLNRTLLWRGTINYKAFSQDFLIDLISPGIDFKNAYDVKFSIGNNLQIKYYDDSYKSFYSIKDTVLHAALKIKLDSVSSFGEFAYFDISWDTNHIFSVHDFIKNFLGRDILTNRTVGLFGPKKYTLLDFWTSWCPPCLKQHQIIKDSASIFLSKKISITGVIIDNTENKRNTISYIVKHNIHWSNIFISTGSQDEQKFKPFNVDIYPTYFLVDNSSNSIIARTQSIMKMFEIIKKIK
ncbi:MAG TPA: thioredoxin-like domain-containing protein, partial [Chitinophagaceae bacterium]